MNKKIYSFWFKFDYNYYNVYVLLNVNLQQNTRTRCSQNFMKFLYKKKRVYIFFQYIVFIWFVDWASNKLDINTRSVLSEWILLSVSYIRISSSPDVKFCDDEVEQWTFVSCFNFWCSRYCKVDSILNSCCEITNW